LLESSQLPCWVSRVDQDQTPFDRSVIFKRGPVFCESGAIKVTPLQTPPYERSTAGSYKNRKRVEQDHFIALMVIAAHGIKNGFLDARCCFAH